MRQVCARGDDNGKTMTRVDAPRSRGRRPDECESRKRKPNRDQTAQPPERFHEPLTHGPSE
jgi:hypothetical protein